jgi:hypothetical protein
MIVLSSDEAVKDLLDRRSSNYSDRPDMFIGQTIASGGLRLVVMVRVCYWRYDRTIKLIQTPLALRKVLANGPQDHPQHSQYKGCSHVCSLSGPGEQSNACRISRPSR